ncbi:hypothetical protein Q4Q34_19300 [Flavivirga abyssicola]|uniref:hypothetical protein n=1 Tax=Flavivirga abyssicola TaxID=3063533 RepID=UPI0026DEB914|nr:hypothetical protein [Flavivirga sp. MEBiC07777]WVK13363.1 hypothetical protein Q4Q34_19300 [Flavivirga sp. MEBiC07777]
MDSRQHIEQKQANKSIIITKPPKWRLHIMRGLFFLNVISLAFDNWSRILFPKEQMDTLTGVTISFWAAFSLLNILGVRFPLKLIPILLLQLLYKTAWIIGTYLPAKKNGLLNEDLESFLWVCIAGIVLNLLIIPWRYVYKYYLRGFFELK